MITNNLFQTGVTLDDIIFTDRNHDYGAYFLRKRYNAYLLIAFLTAFTFVVSAVLGPYIFSSRNSVKIGLKNDGTVIFDPVETPPPPPPPPAPILPLNRVIFVPPVIVDSVVNPEPFLTNIDVIEKAGMIAPPTGPVVFDPPTGNEIVEDNKPFIKVEESATFEGGDLNTFLKWVSMHIQYPEDASIMGMEGKVVVQFVVGKKGNVEDVTIIRKVDPLLDQEAIRVLLTSPAWKPGRQGGRDVRQQFSLPLTFKLQK